MYDIEIKNISKQYGDVIALNNINIQVRKGEIFGLIGPDGAGKTTLIRLIATLLVQNKGEIKALGYDTISQFQEIRNKLGYMPGRFSLYQDLSVIENLELFASIFGTTVEENYNLIKDIYSQIEPFKNRPAGKLSGGMKQKLALSCALIHKPELLLLDEPTTGVDPVSRKEFWEMLSKLKNMGITIFVSTPYMDEASRCDRIAFIQAGEILDIATPDEIISNFDDKLIAVKSDNKYKTLQDLKTLNTLRYVYPSGEYIHYVDSRKEYSISGIMEILEQKGNTNIELKLIEPNIEDCFMKEMMVRANERIIH